MKSPSCTNPTPTSKNWAGIPIVNDGRCGPSYGHACSGSQCCSPSGTCGGVVGTISSYCITGGEGVTGGLYDGQHLTPSVSPTFTPTVAPTRTGCTTYIVSNPYAFVDAYETFKSCDHFCESCVKSKCLPTAIGGGPADMATLGSTGCQDFANYLADSPTPIVCQTSSKYNGVCVLHYDNSPKLIGCTLGAAAGKGTDKGCSATNIGSTDDGEPTSVFVGGKGTDKYVCACV